MARWWERSEAGSGAEEQARSEAGFGAEERRGATRRARRKCDSFRGVPGRCQHAAPMHHAPTIMHHAPCTHHPCMMCLACMCYS
eukprot:COSAG01_NODE_132_length_24759_cov_13.862298_38_plen_84_part_00